MNDLTKKNLCKEYFMKLANVLSDTHIIVKSCNKDDTLYLVPIAEANNISYYGKPANSFRYSDHWSWYANHNKCNKDWYIQCCSKDAPKARKRKAPGKASEPVEAIQVCYYGSDELYECVFGEVYDSERHEWYFLKNGAYSPEEIAAMVKENN